VRFKAFLLDYIYKTNILKGFVITKPINHAVFNVFLRSTVARFLQLEVGK
jgi:hypothetical protein